VYPAAFDYAVASTVDEAVELLVTHADDDVKLLAGGQSLIPLMRLRLARPTHLVDLNGVPDLGTLEVDGEWLRIGALARESALESSEEIGRLFPILRETTSVIADPSVRNLATVGGNLAHGDPANDHPATMTALGAQIVARGVAGERMIAIDDFFRGLFETALEPSEVLTEIRVPLPARGSGSAYRKVKRQVGDFAIVGVAASVTLDAAAVSRCRLVFTNIGSTPVRATRAEAELIGREPGDELLWSAAGAAATEITPPEDGRGPAEYKRRVARALAYQALTAATQRARGLEAG
jgi:carbon-monoxide dehydrogenase medium subunit